MTSKELEEGVSIQLDFSKLNKIKIDVIPVVVQHATTKDVLILAYANKEALQESIHQKIAVFWSTSLNELWIKGAKSGDYLDLVEIRVNCEQNSLLYLVIPRQGGVCHTKDKTGATRKSCFYRTLDAEHLRFN